MQTCQVPSDHACQGKDQQSPSSANLLSLGACSGLYECKLLFELKLDFTLTNASLSPISKEHLPLS